MPGGGTGSPGRQQCAGKRSWHERVGDASSSGQRRFDLQRMHCAALIDAGRSIKPSQVARHPAECFTGTSFACRPCPAGRPAACGAAAGCRGRAGQQAHQRSRRRAAAAGAPRHLAQPALVLVPRACNRWQPPRCAILGLHAAAQCFFRAHSSPCHDSHLNAAFPLPLSVTRRRT